MLQCPLCDHGCNPLMLTKSIRKLVRYWPRKYYFRLQDKKKNTQCSKIGKKCNFKSAKKHYLHFQKWQKIYFCTRKKFKTTKNAIFGLKKTGFLVILNFFWCKIDFLTFLKLRKMCFCTFEIAFFPTLEHCVALYST